MTYNVFSGTLNPTHFHFQLASLLQRRRSPEANQTLHDIWPSPGWYTMYTFSMALVHWRNFARYKIHFASKSCVLLYWQRQCTALQQRTSAKLCGVVQGMELGNFRRRRHLYSPGRPSRWASAHILVVSVIGVFREQRKLLEIERLDYLSSAFTGKVYFRILGLGVTSCMTQSAACVRSVLWLLPQQKLTVQYSGTRISGKDVNV